MCIRDSRQPLCTHLSACLLSPFLTFVSLCFAPCVYLFLSLFLSLFLCTLSPSLSICLCLCLTLPLSVCLSIFIPLFLSLLRCLSVCLSLSLSLSINSLYYFHYKFAASSEPRKRGGFAPNKPRLRKSLCVKKERFTWSSHVAKSHRKFVTKCWSKKKLEKWSLLTAQAYSPQWIVFKLYH